MALGLIKNFSCLSKIIFNFYSKFQVEDISRRMSATSLARPAHGKHEKSRVADRQTKKIHR